MKLVIASLAFAFVSSASFAGTKKAQKKMNHMQVFQLLDLDQNGKLVLNEIETQEILLTEFPKLDKNTDGKLSLKEFSKFSQLKKMIQVSKLDAKPDSL